MVLPQLVLLSIQFIVCAVHIYIPGIALASVLWQPSFLLNALSCLETPAGNFGEVFLQEEMHQQIKERKTKSLVSNKQLMT